MSRKELEAARRSCIPDEWVDTLALQSRSSRDGRGEDDPEILIGGLPKLPTICPA